MTTVKVVRQALSLLTVADRWRLLSAVLAQLFISTFDLLGVLLLGAVVAGAAEDANPIGFLPILRDAVPEVPLLLLGAAALGLMLMKSVLSIVISRKVLSFLGRRQSDISRELARQVYGRPELVTHLPSSQIVAMGLTGGVNAIASGILGQSLLASAEATLLLVLLAGLVIFDPQVSIMAFIYFAIVSYALHSLLSSRAKHLGQKASANEMLSRESVEQVTRGYRELFVASRVALFLRSFDSARAVGSRALAGLIFMNQLGRYVFEISLVVGLGLVGTVLALSDDPAAALATATIFLAAASRIFPSLLRIQTSLVSIRTASGQAEPTWQVVDSLKYSDFTNAGSSASVPRTGEVVDRSGFDSRVTIRSLSIHFEGSGAPLLTDVNLDVRPGQRLAIVGPSGAGKSTLADVIMGVRTPSTGEVLIGGRTPRDAIEAWPGAMAYVPQRVSIMHGSIRQNVALGLEGHEIDDERVIGALRECRLWETVENLPDGLDTLLGDHGTRFSGGQSQRLGLARALYTRPSVVVLDEATSALDRATETHITEVVQSLSHTATVIVIAHGVHAVKNADLFAYVSDGRVRVTNSLPESMTHADTGQEF